MDSTAFRQHGTELIDYICTYLDKLSTRRVVPDMKPDCVRSSLPTSAPMEGEDFQSILADVDKLIMPGITHWQHPSFHAYFPAGNSFPSILGDMLSDAIGCIGFSWAASPACTELEIVVLDWLAKAMNLPSVFEHNSQQGGGVLQGSASDCLLVIMLAARHHKITYLHTLPANCDEATELSKLVGYCSNLAHSCVEKAGMIAFIKIRQLDTDDNFCFRGSTLRKAIEEDKRAGLIPFLVCGTLGTTSCCSCDNIEELGQVAREFDLWFHVDAAYAGSSFICPEFRHFLKGIELVDSLNFNPNKWMLVNFDCSVLWVRNKSKLISSMAIDPVYLQHINSSKAVDFRHWGIPLSRRFRALKLWFVIRSYGINGLQKYIRNHCRLAKYFETLVRVNPNFEIIGQVHFGLVCFRIKGENSLTQCLIRAINESGKIHLTPAMVNNLYIGRFCVCAENAKDCDIEYAWQVIQDFADEIVQTKTNIMSWRDMVSSNTPLGNIQQETLDTFEKTDRQTSNDDDPESITELLYTPDHDLDEKIEAHEKKYDDDEVFVTDIDLGVGRQEGKTMTNLRRNSFFNMTPQSAIHKPTIKAMFSCKSIFSPVPNRRTSQPCILSPTHIGMSYPTTSHDSSCSSIDELDLNLAARSSSLDYPNPPSLLDNNVG